MSEQLKKHEQSQNSETLVSQEQHEHAEKQRHAAAEKASKERSEINLAELRKHAKAEAEDAAKAKQKESEPHDEPDTPIGTQHAIKSQVYKQTLQRVQSHLSKPNQALSKVVHNKTVDTISNVGAQTVARPSGLLGGSICAFIGSLVLLYSAKHYGFRYNYLMFILFFVGGFFVGLILELIIWAVYSRRHRF